MLNIIKVAIAALLVALTGSSCKPINVQPVTQIRPHDRTTEYCDPMPVLDGDSCRAFQTNSGDMITWGADCMSQHKGLVDYVRKIGK